MESAQRLRAIMGFAKTKYTSKCSFLSLTCCNIKFPLSTFTGIMLKENFLAYYVLLQTKQANQW